MVKNISFKLDKLYKTLVRLKLDESEIGKTNLKHGENSTFKYEITEQFFAKDFDMEDAKSKTDQHSNYAVMDTDMHQAIGVAAGYTNLTSALLGYSTGCCSCCNKDEIQRILDIPHKPVLLMGVGIADESKPRRQHHLHDHLTFPTKRKSISR